MKARHLYLARGFGNNEVLRGLNLSIEKGETLVIVGSSGCGKSVLLKHIAGLLTPDSGHIFFEGKDIVGMGEFQLDEIRKKIGFVFQGGAHVIGHA